jgi:hypothetical protein
VTSDPAGVTGGLNSYAYAHGNPAQLKDDNGRWPEFVDNFRRDPVGATKQAAQTYGKVLMAYTETRVAAIKDKAELLNPVTGVIKLGGGLVEKAATEVKEVKAAYSAGGGGAKGTAMAASRALAGPVGAHTSEAMVKAHKAGASPAKVIDAGLSKLSDETNQVNPLYHLGVATVGAPVAAVEAVQRGDPSAAGRHLAEGQASAEEAAQALVPIAEETGLLGKGATGAGAFKALPAGPTEAEMLAPLNAESLGGTRIWIVGPEGASSTRAIRIRGNVVTYDTLAPAGHARVKADMEVIANNFGGKGNPSAPPGDWVSGTHGSPQGEYRGPLSEPRFFFRDRGQGQFRGWRVHDINKGMPLADPNRPLVLSWCYSSSACLPK